ncbi:myotubularin-related protein 13-like [Ostrinia nubilalis]|uniref:myotubularin-related protein 13-like n=1 Tax=Ostrinia nubilalis TaxID=29057 RepID=UPI0030823632
MSRLVDYFVIVGFDHEKERGGLSSGVILQRFPETNWDDTPFHDGIEWFCQPQGWALSTERSEPRFYVSVLTDVDANRHYCACLCFNETVAITPSKPADEDEESLESSRPVSNITHHSIMYAPKCLVIVSRQDYIDTFRNCLGIIYTVWVENLGVPLETLVGNLLGCVLVPPAGGPQVRFSIGAGDRQALQPPAAPPMPVTHNAVYMLLRLLGKDTGDTVDPVRNLIKPGETLKGIRLGCVLVPWRCVRLALQPPAAPPMPVTHNAVYMLLRLLGKFLERLIISATGLLQDTVTGSRRIYEACGAGDRQALQPPAAPPMPVTHNAVYMLLRLLATGLLQDIATGSTAEPWQNLGVSLETLVGKAGAGDPCLLRTTLCTCC